ncbi:MAG TPA: nitrilase-related carbon-nitrogen hydrolase [Verrucomicrobiae bacterium]|nr:nitrilase-related carbon-nitrogen hydrolase [Verrucomicrobiae bacterium]
MALLATGAVIAFHLAYAFTALDSLMLLYLFCLFQLTRVKTARRAFYVGLTVGFLCCAPQLTCFWNIFGPAAIALWLVLAFWIALFLTLGWSCQVRFGALGAALLIPFIWTGLEYFRSELYYLRFSWLNAGYAFAGGLRWLSFLHVGVYGLGILMMAVAALISASGKKVRAIAFLSAFSALAVIANFPSIGERAMADQKGALQVAGVQLEFSSEPEVILSLNKLIKARPVAQLLVMSEYTFDGPVPQKVKVWCREHQRYLIVGGKEPAAGSQFYDTAFVIGPDGNIVFQQGKRVPIQFFKDGLPAREQKLWESPWGKIGLCVCYDLSYTRVTDRLVRLGAQAIIVPTMDVADWGAHQHELHARVAPIRAAEYGIPVFRLASSGISQWVDARGYVTATAPFPGDGAIISGALDLKKPGTLPLDRVIAPISVAVTGLIIAWLAARSFKRKIHH